MSKAVDCLLAGADEILGMARDLSARGMHAESFVFALAAAQHVQAARAFQEMDDASQKLREVRGG